MGRWGQGGGPPRGSKKGGVSPRHTLGAVQCTSSTCPVASLPSAGPLPPGGLSRLQVPALPRQRGPGQGAPGGAGGLRSPPGGPRRLPRGPLPPGDAPGPQAQAPGPAPAGESDVLSGGCPLAGHLTRASLSPPGPLWARLCDSASPRSGSSELLGLREVQPRQPAPRRWPQGVADPAGRCGEPHGPLWRTLLESPHTGGRGPPCVGSWCSQKQPSVSKEQEW